MKDRLEKAGWGLPPARWPQCSPRVKRGPRSRQAWPRRQLGRINPRAGRFGPGRGGLGIGSGLAQRGCESSGRLQAESRGGDRAGGDSCRRRGHDRRFRVGPSQTQAGGPATRTQPAFAARPAEKLPLRASAGRSDCRGTEEVPQGGQARPENGRGTLSNARQDRRAGRRAGTAYPDDPRSWRYMIERWTASTAPAEERERLLRLRAVVRTSTDRALRADAFFTEMGLTRPEWPDGRNTLSRADLRLGSSRENVRQTAFPSPRTRSTEIGGRRVGLIVAAAVIAAPLAIPRRWWKYVIRPRNLVLLLYLLVCLIVLCGFGLLAGYRPTRFVSSVSAQADVFAARLPIISYIFLRRFVSGGTGAILATLAAAAAVGLAVARNRGTKANHPRMSTARSGTLAFLAGLMVLLSADACVLAHQAYAVRDRILRSTPFPTAAA